MLKRKKLDRNLRDLLALDRTRLANQRTMLAFMVTSMHILALGITFEKVKEFDHLVWMAKPLYTLSVVIFLLGAWSFIKVRRDIDRAYGKSDDEE